MKIIYLIIMILMAQSVYSKNKLELYLEKYQSINSFKADIIQKKKLSVLKKVQVSYGTILFKKPKMLLWKLVKPYEYNFILNGNTITKDYPQLNERQVIQVDKDDKLKMLFDNIFIIMGLTGYDKINEQYKVHLNGNVISLYPKQGSFKKILYKIEIHLNNNIMIKELIIIEKNKNKTEIIFENVKTNINISDDQFNLK